MRPLHASVDLIGRTIAGRIRLLVKLGEGGMGTVYRGEQLGLKRTVAVKVLRPELSGNQVLQRRFETEAQAIAKLQHPNIVQVFDFGQDTDGSLFIAMEEIDGQSLRAVLGTEAPLRPARALHIAQQIAASLIEAHARGIVHRDLKPDNVMLQQRGRQRDVVRVLDFGIAKLRDDSRPAATMTQTGDTLGTPEYMAPEQIRGEAIDGRCDIYALGCLLYEMVTARQPFVGPTVMAILSRHVTEEPTPPSQLRPDLGLPPGLDHVVLAAMAKDPNRRPATMEQYADMLAAVVQALPPEPSEHAPYPSHARPAQPRPRTLPLLVLGTLALAGTGLGVWLATRDDSSPRDSQAYYRADLTGPVESKAPPPPSPPPAPREPPAAENAPAKPSAPEPTATPAPPPPRSRPPARRHNYTCAQVATKALALLEAAVTEQLRARSDELAQLTQEERRQLTMNYQKEARALHAKVIQHCNAENWPDAKRACVMNATSFVDNSCE